MGNGVRATRQARRLTQKALAQAVGVRPTMISEIEHDRTYPSVPVLLRLIRALQCDLHDLYWLPDERGA